MAKAQVGATLSVGNGRVGIGLDVLPQADGAPRRNAVVQCARTIAYPHPTVVLLVERLSLLTCEHILETDGHFHILHIGGNGEEFAHEMEPIGHLGWVSKQRLQESVGRNTCHHLGSRCKPLLLWRVVGYPRHVGRIGLTHHLVAIGERQEGAESRLHTLSAAVRRAAAGPHEGPVGKHRRVGLRHAVGNATVLSGAQRCELSTVSLRVTPYLAQPFGHLASQRREVSLVGKLTVHPLVATVARQPARPMTAVMADVERLKPLRHTEIGTRPFGISIVNTPQLLPSGLGGGEERHEEQRTSQ